MVLKGIALVLDYDLFRPMIKDTLGHDLVAAAKVFIFATSARCLTPKVAAELETLSRLYRRHLLRYGTALDTLIDPATIPSGLVLRRIRALIRLADRQMV